MKANGRGKRLRSARRALRSGRHVEALRQTLQIAGKRLRDADLQHEAGELCLALGQPSAARECFTRALEQRPRDPEPLVGLGRACLAEGDVPKAAGIGQVVTQRAPDHAPGHVLHACVLRDLWRLDEAYAVASRAVTLCPDDPEALRVLGEVAMRLGQIDAAEDAYRRWIRSFPDSGPAWCLLGQALARKGHSDDARDAFEKALRLDPDDTVSRWGHYRAVRPVHADEDSVVRERERAGPELEALARHVELRTPAQILRAEAAIQDNFHLHYLGGDLLPLQRQHGALVHRIMRARLPEYAERPPMPPVDDRLRVGFACSYFRVHTVVKLFEGWMTQRDPERFEVFAYHFSPLVDRGTELVRERVEHYALEPSDLEAMARRIASDRLHALVYPEVGMDRQIVKLAALHLAPLQYATFGHPITTGLPSIDVMLSGELVESEGAEAHYSERLVRLPGTGLCVEPPEIPSSGCTRESFGLPEEACVYLSCQSLFKYLPRFDDVFARIAMRVPNAPFAFIGDRQEAVTRVFRARLERAFDRHGLDGAKLVTILPRLDPPRYFALNGRSDVFLDTIDWSAGQSAREALACGLPVVTLPGEFARGRFTQAFLRQIGLPETIAASLDEYVDIAAALGRDPSRRQGLRARIERNRHRLYADRSVISGLEEILAENVAAAAP